MAYRFSKDNRTCSALFSTLETADLCILNRLATSSCVNPATIVFLHGGGVSGWMWQSQIEQLQDYHCLIPDLPEQGQSVNEKPFTIQGSAERIADLIKTQAHDGKAHVVGLSVGAQITLALLSIAAQQEKRP